VTISASTVDQIKRLRDDHEAVKTRAKQTEEARFASDEGRATLEAELAALRAEILAIRKANQAIPDTHDYSEAATRDAFIDLLLAEAGWPLDQPRDREFPVQRMIDDSVTYAQNLIDDFSEMEKAPHIAVSVDVLDTGIDVPEVVNLVFFKIVRSKTKFWQMIGRGTRLRPDLFGPGQDKEVFQIFDFCQNFEFFNQNPERAEPPMGLPIGARLFNTRVELIGELQGLDGHDGLLSDLSDQLHDEVAHMTLDNFLVRQTRRTVEKFQQRLAWEKLTLEDRLDVTSQVAGLPSAAEDDDLPAKQFDLLVLGAILRLLQTDPAFAQYSARIRQIASDLERLDNIPMVKQQLTLILEVQTTPSGRICRQRTSIACASPYVRW